MSKVGVFPYRGSEINAPLADKNYQVYRPAEELASPACIESFRLLPFVDEHAFLGSEEGGGTPAERKGIQGMIGEQIYFDAPYLRGNLKIVSEAAKNLIGNGKLTSGFPGKPVASAGRQKSKAYVFAFQDISGTRATQ